MPVPGDVLVNLAAVHCEPGHRPEEYFETNHVPSEFGVTQPDCCLIS
jgi:hypothetical protein